MANKGCYFTENSIFSECRLLWERAEKAEARVAELVGLLKIAERWASCLDATTALDEVAWQHDLEIIRQALDRLPGGGDAD